MKPGTEETRQRKENLLTRVRFDKEHDKLPRRVFITSRTGPAYLRSTMRTGFRRSWQGCLLFFRRL